MKIRVPIHARYSPPDEFASVEVSASVEINVPDDTTQDQLNEMTNYAMQLELYLAKEALPYAKELLAYVQNNYRTTVRSPDQLRLAGSGPGGDGAGGKGAPQGRRSP